MVIRVFRERHRLNWSGQTIIKESIKTTSVEYVCTGVLDRNKQHYLRNKDKADKSYDVLRHIQLHMSKYKKRNEELQSIMSNIQPNCCLKVDFQNVDKHIGGKWLIYDTERRTDNLLQRLELPCKISKSWLARCDIKGSDAAMLNPIFRKKVQGQKHPGEWDIAERQIPSRKMLLETNTVCHGKNMKSSSPSENDNLQMKWFLDFVEYNCSHIVSASVSWNQRSCG